MSLLEGLHSTVVQGTVAGYRTDRRSQRRTVRDYWYMEGRLYRPRERSARTLWYLCLGCLKDKGPAVTLIIKPHEPASTTTLDKLASTIATETGFASANAKDCFAHDLGFDCGILAAAVPLEATTRHGDVTSIMRKQVDSFAKGYRDRFDQAIESGE